MGEVIPELDLEETVISPRDQIGIKYNFHYSKNIFFSFGPRFNPVSSVVFNCCVSSGLEQFLKSFPVGTLAF